MTEEIKTKTAIVPVEGAIKKKRPWRHKVRREAAKKAKREARANAPIDSSEPDIKRIKRNLDVVLKDSSLKTKSQLRKERKAKEGKEGKEKEKEKDEKKGKENKKKDPPTQSKKKGSKKVEDVDVEEEDKITDVSDEFRKKLESGRFRFLNEKLYTMSGSDALQFFEQEPEAFDCYHKGFTEQVKKWPNHPLQTIVKWLLKLEKGQVVYDLGCGEAKIAEKVGDHHTVHSFDLVAINERVTSCDMANLPVEDNSADVVIFCLSLMGTNIPDFIKEARRVLKIGGILKIAEVTSRFTKVNLFAEAVCQLGFELGYKNNLTDYFMMMQFKKIAKVENKRPYGLKLKPCIYKRR
ncbi:unnamed protein product [Auanema sp. JU1783]|nr:unnamed protein product [Auanema sp. JU1783]